MEISGVGKSPNASLSFRYNANNEELEELYQACEDDPPTPQCDPPPLTSHSENASPKKGEKTSSLIDKYFKSMRVEKSTEKSTEKADEGKPLETKSVEEPKPPKEVTSSPMKEYLNRLGKRSTAEVSPDVKEGPNETWKIFHDFKFKIAQAVEDMKTRSSEETKEKTVLRDNSMSDSEENSVVKDIDQQSVGDTDNQVSSLESSMQNLSEMTQPLTAKATERESSLPTDNKNNSDSSDDTHKNLVFNTEVNKEFLEESNTMEVESGVEALEDSMDGFGDVNNVNQYQNNNPVEFETERHQPTPTNFGLPPSKTNFKLPPPLEPSKKYFFNFSMYFLTFLIFLNLILFPNSSIWNGFIFGLWFFCFASNLQCWVLDNYFTECTLDRPSLSNLHLRRSSMKYVYTIPAVKEHRPLKKYENWINHYRFPEYDPETYHINKTTTAFMKLEGCNLRISYTRTKISKRALWDEKIENIVFYQHRLYNLTGARVILLPKGLVKRRQWSKKYPICVILSDKEKVQVFEKESVPNEKKVSESLSEKKKEQLQHEMETETNTSPEKKRKFVWRRKEKTVVHSEGEVGKEGLRHRLVRKMHRDKKTDVSTGTDPVESPSPSPVADKSPVEEIFQDADELASKSVTSAKEENEEEFDENELSKIKEFLEEAEMEGGVEGTVEGEWSVHVKQTSSNLYLFTRTGRDKHEWYRRLVTAITEANAASNETSAADDKTANEMSESRDIMDIPPYKTADKDTVTFSKTSGKTVEQLSVPEGGTVFLSQLSHTGEDSYENFWPYLTKIIQQNKGSMGAVECECQRLPAEVTWVNTVLARFMYDVMRDPVIQQRLQNRIQRKLNTIKLPSFMSPLVVTELSLSGSCPQVSRAVGARADARGLWLDALLRYDGGAHIVLLTQINLMKLKEKNITLEDQIMSTHDNIQVNVVRIPSTSEGSWARRRSAAYDSDVEDSAESSSDDETPPIQPVDSKDTITSEPGYSSQSLTPNSEGGSSKRKFLRMVDKIATNKYFQQVTDYKYVKRAMEGLSNTDIKLQLELHSLEGQLAINLPAPPHDRIWIGFRHNPQLILKARPAVGARTLRFAHISNWIEQKLMKEFEKVLVLPNMEDIIVDIMTPTPVAFE